MKKSSPISLFSFQDIVTSLTGVMILIVLVILLQLFETVQMVMENQKQQPEYLVYKDAQAKLRKELEALKAAKLNPQEQDQQFAELTTEQLKAKVLDTQKVIDDHKQRQQKMEKQTAHYRRESDILIRKLTLMRQQQQRDKQLFKMQSETMKRQIQEQKQALLILLAQIEKKKKAVSYSFPGMVNYTPLLIECTAWGFRLKVYPGGNVITLGEQGKTTVKGRIPTLRSTLKDFRPSQFYTVLLFRKEALTWQPEILHCIRTDYHYGMDLLDSNEESF